MEIKILSRQEILKELFKSEIKMILAELCFTTLPFIALILINMAKNSVDSFFSSPDWSLATAVLFGQTIVKLMIGIGTTKKTIPSGNYGLITALIIVFGLIPSIVILGILQFQDTPQQTIIVLQFILFIMSILAFLFFGTIGNMLKTDADKDNQFDNILSAIKTLQKSK